MLQRMFCLGNVRYQVHGICPGPDLRKKSVRHDEVCLLVWRYSFVICWSELVWTKSVIYRVSSAHHGDMEGHVAIQASIILAWFQTVKLWLNIMILEIWSRLSHSFLSRWCHQPGWQTADGAPHARSLPRQHLPPRPWKQVAFQWRCGVWWLHDWLAALQWGQWLHQQLWAPGGTGRQRTGSSETQLIVPLSWVRCVELWCMHKNIKIYLTTHPSCVKRKIYKNLFFSCTVCNNHP